MKISFFIFLIGNIYSIFLFISSKYKVPLYSFYFLIYLLVIILKSVMNEHNDELYNS